MDALVGIIGGNDLGNCGLVNFAKVDNIKISFFHWIVKYIQMVYVAVNIMVEVNK